MVVLAHLTTAEAQAKKGGAPLPERFALAQATRPKVLNISNGTCEAREVTASPIELLRRTVEAISKAKFTGKGDKPVVQQMMSEFEWLIKTAVESAQVDPLEVTLDPRIHNPPFAAGLSSRWSNGASRRNELTRSSGAAEAEEALELNDEEDESSRLSIVIPSAVHSDMDKDSMGINDTGIRLQSEVVAAKLSSGEASLVLESRSHLVSFGDDDAAAADNGEFTAHEPPPSARLRPSSAAVDAAARLSIALGAAEVAEPSLQTVEEAGEADTFLSATSEPARAPELARLQIQEVALNERGSLAELSAPIVFTPLSTAAPPASAAHRRGDGQSLDA